MLSKSLSRCSRSNLNVYKELAADDNHLSIMDSHRLIKRCLIVQCGQLILTMTHLLKINILLMLRIFLGAPLVVLTFQQLIRCPLTLQVSRSLNRIFRPINALPKSWWVNSLLRWTPSNCWEDVTLMQKLVLLIQQKNLTRTIMLSLMDSFSRFVTRKLTNLTRAISSVRLPVLRIIFSHKKNNLKNKRVTRHRVTHSWLVRSRSRTFSNKSNLIRRNQRTTS